MSDRSVFVCLGSLEQSDNDNVTKGGALSHTHNVMEGGNFGAAAGLLEGAENCPQVDT